MVITPITHRLPARCGALAILTAVAALTAPATAQQTPVILQITAPADGTIVAPGATISVTVSSPANVAFTGVGVIGESPIPLTDIATAVPAQFSITIPTKIASRTYALTAMGTTSAGQDVESEPIEIDVERSDMPTSLSALLPRIIFQAQGETSPVTLIAKFPDGSAPDVTESSRVTYISSSPAVATVDETGIVTAVAAGQATITATYRLNAQQAQLAIPVTVPKPALRVEPSALDFGDLNIGASASQDLKLSNVGTQPLTIVAVSAAGDFSSSDDCQASPLRAGEFCTINVTFAPTDPGASPGSVAIFHDATVLPDSFPLAGNGVGRPATTTVIAASASPSVSGQSVTLTASVTTATGDTPSGDVTFTDGDALLGTVTLTTGQAVFTTSSFSVGTHTIAAAFPGDATLAPSVATVDEIVAPASTDTVIVPSANPAELHSSVSLRANVSVTAPGAGTPTGTITFTSGASPFATFPLDGSGDALFSLSTSEVGVAKMTAAYSGDANFQSSSSPELIERVEYQPAGTMCDGGAGHQVLAPLVGSGNTFQRGRTVPVKFRVCDANGVSMGTAGVVIDFYELRPSDPTGRAQVSSMTPQAAFRWDPTDRQWIFNLETRGLAPGGHRFAIELNDGTTIMFGFILK